MLAYPPPPKPDTLGALDFLEREATPPPQTAQEGIPPGFVPPLPSEQFKFHFGIFIRFISADIRYIEILVLKLKFHLKGSMSIDSQSDTYKYNLCLC